MNPIVAFGYEWRDWQAVKENAWSNPLLVIAFAAAGGGFACILYSSAFLIGGELSTVLLFHMAARYEGTPEKYLGSSTPVSSASLQQSLTETDGSTGFQLNTDGVVLHPAKMISLVIFMSIPPAACTLVVVFYQLIGSMGKVRLDTFFPAVTRVALPWSAIWWLLCLYTFLNWETSECIRVERLHEPLCYDTAQDEPAKVARHMCRSETGSECALVLFILGMYTLSSTAVLIGTALCGLGLWQAKQDHELKWRRPDNPGSVGRQPNERQPLLA